MLQAYIIYNVCVCVYVCVCRILIWPPSGTVSTGGMCNDDSESESDPSILNKCAPSPVLKLNAVFRNRIHKTSTLEPFTV